MNHPTRLSLLRVLLAALLLLAAGVTRVAAQPTDGFPPKAKPSEPGWGHYKGWDAGWPSRHQGLLARTAQGGVDILFLGDSLTSLWAKEGKAEWDTRFAPLKAANYGIGGDSTRQVIWRLEHGELDNLHPRLVVLMIGTNNIYQDHNSGTDAEIVEGVARIVGLIREKAPAARILLLGVLPRQNAYFTNRVAGLNRALAAYASAEKIPFADFHDQFLGADVINPALFKADRIHLSPEGYAVLGAALAPEIARLLAP